MNKWSKQTCFTLLLFQLITGGDSSPFNVAASATMMADVEKFQEDDPKASFTFFNGHVDSFATSSKDTIPEYAQQMLIKQGLPRTPQTPRKLPGPINADDQAKPGNVIDADLTTQLPYVKEEDANEFDSRWGTFPWCIIKDDETCNREDDEEEDPNMGNNPPDKENRTNPPDVQYELLDWDHPSDKILERERIAAHGILKAFLKTSEALFEVNESQFETAMSLKSYEHGAYYRRAEYMQYYRGKEQILYGKTLAHFDINWNVVSLSRMIVTQEKLDLTEPQQVIHQKEAIGVASSSKAGCSPDNQSTIRADLMVSIIRNQYVWNVEIATGDGGCQWRTIIDPENGDVLNVSDLILRFADASFNRWKFDGGDLTNPSQRISTNQVTRNDRRLENEFFYVMNDNRCEGEPQKRCLFVDEFCAEAYGSSSGDSFIRATRRPSRNFDSYFPDGPSETFGETNAYYWANLYCRWLKPVLDIFGKLPPSASDYTRVLIITNVCKSNDWMIPSTFQPFRVTTESNKGEGDSTIVLGHRTTNNEVSACEGSGCFDNPSAIHHELTHFFLLDYFGVGGGDDCSEFNELTFLHEGALGTVLPQAFWHNCNSVGYNPSSDKLFLSGSLFGQVHVNDASLMKLTDYQCNVTDPYVGGRVVGQALWKIYHGKKVDGASITNTWYPANDETFNYILYKAADLTSGSTRKDREEYANRVMQLIDKENWGLPWTSGTKMDYCDIFATHELDGKIDPAYCS